MSIWYDTKVTIYGPEEKLSEISNIPGFRGEYYTFSSGACSGPGFSIVSFCQKHKDVIVYVEQGIETDSYNYIARWDSSTDEFQEVKIDSFACGEYSFNRKIYEDYEQKYPDICANFWRSINESLDLKHFLLLKDNASHYLSNYKDYAIMAYKVCEDDGYEMDEGDL